jgi:predicted peptidase
LRASILIVFVFLAGCNTDDPLGNPPAYLQEVLETQTWDYLLYVPTNTSAQEARGFPLIISLHGIGERGNDPQRVKRDGLAKVFDSDPDFPFYMVAPQCPESTEWYYDRTDTLTYKFILMILQRYPVDPDRVYITGFSMGGIGAWDMAIRYPELFAAVAPIAARRESYWNPCSMKKVPIWAFHGAMDDVVPLAAGQDVVDAFKACGGTVQFTIYPGVYHDSWTRAYSTQQLYDWLLQQRRVSQAK